MRCSRLKRSSNAASRTFALTAARILSSATAQPSDKSEKQIAAHVNRVADSLFQVAAHRKQFAATCFKLVGAEKTCCTRLLLEI
jgi:hypothetical protein